MRVSQVSPSGLLATACQYSPCTPSGPHALFFFKPLRASPTSVSVMSPRSAGNSRPNGSPSVAAA
eukprot:6272249-Pyramimonas_sp.AAC.1